MNSFRGGYRHYKYGLWFSVIAGLFVAFNSVAQSNEGVIINTTINTGVDSNFFKTAEKESVVYAGVSPFIGLGTSFGKHHVKIAYLGDYVSFIDKSDFSYAAHSLNVDGLLDLSKTFNMKFKGFYVDSFEEPGNNDSITTSDISEFNRFKYSGVQTQVEIGTTQSLGQLTLALGLSDRSFKNNEQPFRDVESEYINGVFYYRFSHKLRGLLEVTVTNLNYEPTSHGIDLTNTENEVLAGVEWALTEKTQGSVKVGHLTRNYNTQQLEQVSGLSYVINLSWLPTNLTKFTLDGTRRPMESAQIGISGFFRDSIGVIFNHELKRHLVVFGDVRYSNYDISDIGGRNDRKVTYEAGLKYSVRSWLESRLLYRNVSRQSNVSTFDFDSHVFELSISSKFK